MTKPCIIFILFLFITSTLFANRIDNLSSDSDVIAFLKETNKKLAKNGRTLNLASAEQLKRKLECDSIIKDWDLKSWEKVDINSDKRTDLLVTLDLRGAENFVVIDNGDDTFKFIPLAYSPFADCEAAKVLKVEDDYLVLFHSMKGDVNEEKALYLREKGTVDTLIFEFGDFIERYQKSSLKVTSLKFEAGMCFGECPVFTVSIDNNGNGIYEAKEYPSKKGVFKTKIDLKRLTEIRELLDYISFNKIQNNYAVNWTDYPTYQLHLTFSDGSEKHIKDYGGLGTFSLRRLYSLLFDLRQNQKWVKITGQR